LSAFPQIKSNQISSKWQREMNEIKGFDSSKTQQQLEITTPILATNLIR